MCIEISTTMRSSAQKALRSESTSLAGTAGICNSRADCLFGGDIGLAF
jgi:hypothetical protein